MMMRIGFAKTKFRATLLLMMLMERPFDHGFDQNVNPVFTGCLSIRDYMQPFRKGLESFTDLIHPRHLDNLLKSCYWNNPCSDHGFQQNIYNCNINYC